MNKTLRLSIEGMHCGACVRRVTDAVQRVDGVNLNSVDVGSAQMTFNSDETTAEEIAASVNRIGFQANIEQ